MSGFGIREALTDILDQMIAFGIDLIPRLITGIVVVVIGLIVAKIFQRVLRGLLDRLKFDALMDRVGIAEILRGIGVRDSIGASIARLTYYLIVILFVQNAANAVGLLTISGAITAFFGYLPALVATVMIVILGNVVAGFARSAVEESARDSGVEFAPALGQMVYSAIMFIVAIMAIAQLGIDTAEIRLFVTVALAGAALGFALSFGLGTREVTRHIVAGFYARKLFQIGQEVELAGQRGVLTAITPTQTLLDQDGRTVSVPNGTFLDQVAKQ